MSIEWQLGRYERASATQVLRLAVVVEGTKPTPAHEVRLAAESKSPLVLRVEWRQNGLAAEVMTPYVATYEDANATETETVTIRSQSGLEVVKVAGSIPYIPGAAQAGKSTGVGAPADLPATASQTTAKGGGGEVPIPFFKASGDETSASGDAGAPA